MKSAGRPTAVFYQVILLLLAGRTSPSEAACPSYKWQCLRTSGAQVCLDRFSFQDGIRDCPDGSDEECLPWQFDCQLSDAESPRCIDIAKYRDGVVDCSDGRDEKGLSSAVTNGCKSSPCRNLGTCKPVGGLSSTRSYQCTCRAGYTGSNCEIAFGVAADPCVSSPCQNGATCLSTTSRYICQCRLGYRGRNCQLENA